VDGQTAYHVETVLGVERFLCELRQELRSGSYRPLAVRERQIPKRGGKKRRLGIPTITDRVVQAALKLVLEPIFEADFQPCSYGFRPGRRAQDAIAEVHYLTSRSYEWMVEADIEACFDRIDHTALMDRARRRIKDKRVLAQTRRSCMPGSSPSTAASSGRSPAPRKAGSSPRYWPTSRSRHWTSTSPRPGSRWAPTRDSARRVDAEVRRPTDSSATPTIS
jgi:hypothetical protein